METKILFIADVVGEPGMNILERSLPGMRLKYSPDIVIVNGENTRAGKGLSEGLARKYFQLGINVITSGNHIWDFAAFHNTLNNPGFSNIIRPMNYPEGVPGRGFFVAEASNGAKVCVINLQGRTFMAPIDCPFKNIREFILKVNSQAKITFIDFHAEATAEKIAMGKHLNGYATAVVGTHTHVQTADEEILSKGTAYITDAGMTGPYDGVIGMKTETAINRFRFQTPFKYEIAEGDARLNGVYIVADSDTGKAISIERISFKENQI
jgi:2',3'-cyclic-nucleotide 2'-phosphodiesterase